MSRASPARPLWKTEIVDCACDTTVPFGDGEGYNLPIERKHVEAGATVFC